MTQMIPRVDKQKTIKDLLEKAAPSIAAILPKR